MLQLYDLNKVKIKGLTQYKDYCIESVLSSGDKILSFLYLSKLSEGIKEEGYIRTKKDEFVIKEIADRGDWKAIKATLNVEDLEGQVFEHFNTTEQTIEQCLTLALAGTGWTVQINGVTKRRTIRKTNCSTWEIVQQAKKTYLVEIQFDTVNKIVKVAEKLGSDKGVYFMDSLNLRSFEIQSNSYEFYTRLIAIGKGDLKVTVENFQYSNKRKTLIWKDERYTDINALTEDATAKLAKISKPYRAYGADIIDLANMSDKYSILSYGLGDSITLISKEKGIREKQRIVKVTEYPEEPERNSCEIANTILTFADIQKEYQDATETVKNITSDNGTISEGAIKVAVESITIKKADIGSLNAAEARIGTLEVTTATITQLNASNARIDNLIATTATITQLNAASAKIDILEGKVGSFDTLVAGNLTAKNMQAGFITAESGLIANGAIKDAMILNLSVSKILAGDISTSKFRVVSDTGNMLIADNTIQIKDSTRVRVQIGKDASNDYNMYVWDAAGNLMFDATGLKANGIKTKIIRDDMVSDTANINGTKLNINSVVSSINGATTLLKASKINLDTEAQTLDLAFTSLKSTVTSTSNTVTSQGTAITAIQGQISSKIWQQDITIAVDGVQFGGRNLFKIGTVGKYAGGTVSEKSAAISITGYKISVLSNPLDIIGNVIENLGTEIIISGRTNATVFKSWYRFSNGTQQSATPTVTNGYFVLKLSVPSGATYLNLGLGEYPYTKPYYIENVKVENGNKVSDFTCAPEDTEEKITTVTNNYSALNQTVSSINANVNSLQTTTSNLGTRVSSAEGSLSILQNQISLKVSQSDIDTSINKIQIGGRNYVLKSEGMSDIYRSKDIVSGLKAGDTFTMSLDFDVEGLVAGSQSRIGAEGSILKSDGSTFYFGLWHNISDGVTFKGRKSRTMTVPSNAIGDLSSITFYTNLVNSTSTKRFIGNLKIEKGNRHTDWSPAPEDIDQAIDTVDTKVNTANSEINVLKNQISLKVESSTFNSTVSTLNSNVSSLQTRVSAAEQKITDSSIISTVRSSTAYTNDLNSKEGSIVKGSTAPTSPTANQLWLDTSITPNVLKRWNGSTWVKGTPTTATEVGAYSNVDGSSLATRVTTAESSITQLNNSITSKVSQTDFNSLSGRVTTSETTITQHTNQIATKVDVAGVKSTIEQNPTSVKVAFNKISSNIQTDEGGQFIIRSGALKVYNTRGNHYLSTGYSATGDNYVYTQGRYQASMEPGRTYVYPDGTTAVNKSATNMSPFGIEHENSDGREMYIRSNTNITIANLGNTRDRALNLFELNGSTIRTFVVNGARAEMWQNCINSAGTTDTNLWLNKTSGSQVVVGNGSNTGWGKIVAETLYITGSKNCIQKTENYGWREMNALETPEYYYSDFGRGKLLDGKCVIWIEDIFSETVNMNMDYHVFVSKYGRGDIWVSERNPNYFVVEGDNDIEFSWQFVAKRIGFEHVRLELAETQPEPSMDFRVDEEDQRNMNITDITDYYLTEMNSGVFTNSEMNFNELEQNNDLTLSELNYNSGNLLDEYDKYLMEGLM